MRKYWTMYSLGLQNAVVYRGPMLFWILGSLIQSLIIIALWFSLPANSTLGSYSRNELITYSLFAFILGRLLGWYPANWIRDEIKSGEIVGNIILKPVDFYKRIFMGEASWRTVSLIFESSISIILVYTFRNYFVFLFTWQNIPFILLAVIMAILIVETLSV